MGPGATADDGAEQRLVEFVRRAERDRDLAERARLLYVATTRAKSQLHYVYPAVDVYRGPETDGTPTLSRFLEPIPPSILPHASLLGE